MDQSSGILENNIYMYDHLPDFLGKPLRAFFVADSVCVVLSSLLFNAVEEEIEKSRLSELKPIQ
jgi:hypothetical protein